MSSTDREPEVSEPPAADGGPAAWPPQEAAPPDDGPKKTEGTAAASSPPAEASEPKPAEANAAAKVEAKVEAAPPAPAETDKPKAEAAHAAAADEPKAEAPPAAAADEPKAEAAHAAAADEPKAEAAHAAALPAEEMPFSNSTLHWLEDEDQGQEEDPSHRITVPGYDPTAPVAGRRRAVAVVGGAGALALVVTGVLYLMAPKKAVAPEPVAAEPARELTARAEAALAANKIGDAVDLARLALVADPRFADAHFIVGVCDKARNEIPGAREELRRYLELAPLGTHAAAAREALAALPP